MAINLKKGGGINLTKSAPTLSALRVGLGWDRKFPPGGADFDLDSTVFVCKLNEAGEPKLISDEHFIFYNNLKTPNGSVVHKGDNRTGAGEGDDETILVNLPLLEADCQEISFIVTIHEGIERNQNFGQITNAYIKIYNDATGEVICEYDLDEKFSSETAVQFGSLLRANGEWSFKAVGIGYRLGLGDFVEGYQ